MSCIEEAQCVFTTFSDWLTSAQNNFSTVAISVDIVDRFAMERKMKKLEVLCAFHLYLIIHRTKVILMQPMSCPGSSG